MKKVINSLFVIIAAMVTFAGCAKHEVDAPEVTETKLVHFFAESIETKTHFDDKNDEGKYPTLWDAGDRVKVFLNLEQPSSVKGLETIVDVEVSEDSKSARFNAEINSEYEFDSFTFYAISPSSAYNARSSKEGRFTVQIDKDQTPQPTSVDKDVQVLYSISATTDEFPSSVQMHFKHFTAYGKLSLINLTDKITEISSLKLSFPENVVGKWNYFVADGRIEAKEATNEIELTTSSTDEIWFACAPVDVSGKTITLTVTTDKGDLVKEITFPENRKFEAGKIAKFTVDMEGITAGGSEEPEQPGETTDVWTLVTDASKLAVGDKVVIVAANENYALATTQNNNNRASVAITKSEDNTIEVNDDVQVITLQEGNKPSTFAFHTGDAGYLYAASSGSNHLKTKTTLDDNGSWDITIAGGVATIKAQGTYTRNWLRFNTSNSPKIFACYGSGQTDVALYRLSDDNTGGETPEPEQPTLSPRNLAFSSATATATIGQEFTAPTLSGEIAGVTYSSSNTAVATVNASTGAVTLVGAGTTTIKASALATDQYEAGEASYTLTVSAAPEGGDDSTVLVTVSNTIAKLADANSWKDATKYTTVNLDEIITASVSGGSNTGKYYVNGENWRIYQNENPSLKITAVSGCTIKTVKITYTVSNSGTLTYNNSKITSGTVVNVNADSIAFGVGNTGSATNGQVRVTAIEVVYQEN